MVLFFVIFGMVFMFGNKYSSLYHTDKATVFNAGEAMMQAEKDLDKINAHLATFTAKKELRPNGENLTKLFDEINNTIGIDSYGNKNRKYCFHDCYLEDRYERN